MNIEEAEEFKLQGYIGKRFLDLLASGTGCVIFAPLAAGIAAAIILEDGGPAFFFQTRVGLRRTPFTIIKFRSMRNKQITRVGIWLRRTGLDELPQFINVIRGEMSMVGPRPLTGADVERLRWERADHDWRFAKKPGVTGLSQLLAGRGARTSEKLDRLYLRKQNLTLDVRLLALSFAVNMVGKRRIKRWMRERASSADI